MRICYVANGSSIHTKRWVKWFVQRGHNVILLTDYPIEMQGVEIHFIGEPGNLMRFIKRGINTRKIIKKIKPDIVHAHFAFGYGTWTDFSGFHPYIVSLWGSDIIRIPENSFLHRFLVNHALKKADIILCVDDGQIERVNQLIGHNENVLKLGWGIDAELFKPDKIKVSDKIRILNLRKFHDPYKMEYFIQALPKVIQKHTNVEFIFLKAGKKLEEAMNEIKNMGLEKFVTFIEERPNEDLPALMNTCDIYAESGYTDIHGGGVGMTPLEAMSCGMPVVFSNSADVEMYIEHGKTGLIYKGCDPDALAAAIVELIEKPQLRERLGSGARDYILLNQNWHKNMLQMEELYMSKINAGE